jgi:hypothetical protein
MPEASPSSKAEIRNLFQMNQIVDPQWDDRQASPASIQEHSDE